MADTKGYVVGDWNAYCDYCGGQYLASQLKTDYWGFKACSKDFTLPNPQMFVRPKTEKIVVPWTRRADGTEAYQVPYTAILNGASVELQISDVQSGITEYVYTTVAGGNDNLDLHPPNLAVLNIQYQITVTHAAKDASGNTSIGKIIFTPLGCTFVGNTILNPGEVAMLIMDKTANRWRRI